MSYTSDPFNVCPDADTCRTAARMLYEAQGYLMWRGAADDDLAQQHYIKAIGFIQDALAELGIDIVPLKKPAIGPLQDALTEVGLDVFPHHKPTISHIEAVIAALGLDKVSLDKPTISVIRAALTALESAPFQSPAPALTTAEALQAGVANNPDVTIRWPARHEVFAPPATPEALFDDAAYARSRGGL